MLKSISSIIKTNPFKYLTFHIMSRDVEGNRIMMNELIDAIYSAKKVSEKIHITHQSSEIELNNMKKILYNYDQLYNDQSIDDDDCRLVIFDNYLIHDKEILLHATCNGRHCRFIMIFVTDKPLPSPALRVNVDIVLSKIDNDEHFNKILYEAYGGMEKYYEDFLSYMDDNIGSHNGFTPVFQCKRLMDNFYAQWNL